MNVNAILGALSVQFKDHKDANSELSRKDKKVVQHLVSILCDGIDDVEQEEQLDISEMEIEFKDDLAQMGEILEMRKYSVDQMKEIVKMKFEMKRQFSTINNRFRKLNNEKEIYRMRKYVENGGTNFHKWFNVSTKLFSKFKNSREQFLPVHDIDLKRWALEFGREEGLSLDEFQASDSWILNFKNKYRISSRKVTKFVTRRQFVNQEELEDNAITFTLECRDKFKDFDRNNIINFDQSGFNYELTIPRTLSNVNERNTFCLIRCSHAITHSYTVLPSLTASGNFLPICLVILQEVNGVFGPQVAVEVSALQQKLKNLHILPSRSGLMQSNQVEIYKNEVLKKYINGNAILVHDGWKGQTSDNLFSDLPNIERMIIPAGCTDKAQPCDMMLFRQWKYLGKRCYLRVLLDDLKDIDLRNRHGIITLQSLIFNQLCAPVFQPMLKQAWKQYFDDVDCDYPTVKDICFKNLPPICDSFNLCNGFSFIRCSHCQMILCFSCFFSNPHLHC